MIGRLLLLLGFWVGALASVPAAWASAASDATTPSWRAELAQIERLPRSAHVEARKRLEALLPQVPADGVDTVELLYQLGVLLTNQIPPDPQAVEALAPRWQAWRQQAGRERIGLALLAEQLLRINALVNAHRYAEAQALLPSLALGVSPAPWPYRVAMARAAVLEEVGELDTALQLRLESVALAQSRPARAMALASLAFTHYRLDQQERAEAVALESVAEATAEPSDELLARTYSALSTVQSARDDQRNSRETAEKALVYARRTGDAQMLANFLANLADTYLRENQPQRALELAEEAYPLALRTGDRATEALALQNGGFAKIRLRRVAEGRAAVQRGIALDLESGAATYAAVALEELGRTLESVGDLAGAYQSFDEYRALLQKLQRSENRKTLAQAQARFDSAQRDRDSARLQRDNELRATAIQSQSLRAALAALFIGAGLALAFLLLLLIRRLRQTNQGLLRLNAELSDSSQRDALTGLGNRRRLSTLLPNPERWHGALLLLDIDHFKSINDQHGHAAGDAVLIALAGRLQAVVRTGDVLLRWGGEEFLVWAPEIDAEGLRALAQRLLDGLSREAVSLRDGRSVAVSTSIGALAVPLAPHQLQLALEPALALADLLLYRAKSTGRNRALILEQADLPSAEAVREALKRDALPLWLAVGPSQAGGSS